MCPLGGRVCPFNALLSVSFLPKAVVEWCTQLAGKYKSKARSKTHCSHLSTDVKSVVSKPGQGCHGDQCN